MAWWWLIGLGCLVILAAGFASVFVLRRRAALGTTGSLRSRAEAAVEIARISRDASHGETHRADELIDQAQLLLATGRGSAAARQALTLARRADRLFRRAT